jgi:hypothetical protein
LQVAGDVETSEPPTIEELTVLRDLEQRTPRSRTR